jgi:hypothetical protein
VPATGVLPICIECQPFGLFVGVLGFLALGPCEGAVSVVADVISVPCNVPMSLVLVGPVLVLSRVQVGTCIRSTGHLDSAI